MLRHRHSLSAFYLPAVCGLLFSSSLARANPTGAQVVNGAVGMETIGNTLKITAPDRSIIHWQNFSIAAGETTQFIQPGSMATVLNRVTSGEASHLMGTLQANGRVYLLNPNGIFIGNGAVVDVGSFMATTAHLTDEAFLKGGDFQLTGASDAPIRNAGTITARNGDVFLLAQVVENTGSIRAAQGTVGLMAGREFYVKKEEAGAVKVMVNASQVPGAKKGIGVDQRGTIEALRANLEADGNAYALAINQAGVVRATGVNQMADGTVALSAPGGKILNSGQIVAANQNGAGGKISASGTEVVFEAASMLTAAGTVDGGEVKIAADGDNLVSGRFNVNGATGKGGRIELTGNRVGLFDAEVTADGATGGGEVLVGGDYLGMNALVRNAKATVMDRDSVISADATMTGDGGKVILWSDEYTGFYGDISAQGGSVSGNGGFIETSSKINLQAMGSVTAAAVNGQGGEWLLDPSNVSIAAAEAGGSFDGGSPNVFTPTADDATVNAADIETSLNGGTSVTILTSSGQSQAGNITMTSGISKTVGGAATLTMISAGTITIGQSISSTTGALNVVLGAQGSVTISSAITTNGGDLTIQGSNAAGGALAASAGGVDFGANISTGAGDLKVTSNFAVLQSAGTILIGGDANIQMLGGGGDGINLTDPNNDFAGVVSLVNESGASAIRDVNSLTLGTLSMGTPGSGGNLTVVSTGALDLGQGTVEGDLVVTSNGGAVSQTAGLTVTGTTTLTAGAGNIDLSNSSNSFGGAVRVVSGNDVTLQDSGTLRFGLGVSTTSGNLSVTAGTIAIDTTGITSGGSQTYTGAVTLGDDTTLTTTDSDVTFSATIENAVARTLTIEAGTGAVTFGGAVGGGGTALQSLAVTGVGGTVLMNGGTVTTAGLQNYAGTVDLGVDTTLTTSGGNISFGSDITGAGFDLDMTTGAGGITVAGAVGGNAPNQLGNLTIASNGTVTFNGTLDIGAFSQTGTGSTTFNANLETGAGFSFGGNELTFFAGSGDNVVGGDITISNTGAFELAPGATLASAGVFAQNGAGAVSLGGDVSSTDAMTFSSAITLTGAVVLQNTNPGSIIDLQNTVDGGFGLTVTSSGTARFGGVVGATPLASLTVSGTGITIDTTAITTSGAQNFTGPVTLGAGTTLTTTDSNVTFSGATTTISGAQALTIAAGTGTVTFGAAVGAGALTALTSLEVTGGTIAVNGGEVETTGTQLYTGAVTLGDDTTLTTANSDVTFNTSVSTIQNAVAQTLTIAAGTGTVTFGGAVGGGGTALQSLVVTGVGGNILMDASTVTTTGLQSYTGAVDLGVDTTLTTAGGGIIFGATIGTTTGRALELNSGAGDITVTGAVGSNSDELGDLRVVSANNVTFQDTLDIAAYIQDAGTGTTEFQANLETGAGFSFTGNELTFAAGSGNNVVGGGMTVSNVGVFTLAPGATLASAGVFDQTGAGAVSLGGDVSSADAMTFNSAITLTGTVELQNAAGNLELQNTVAGGFGLTVTSAGTVSFEGALGGVGTELTSLAVTGTTIAINGGSVRTSGDQIYTGPVTLGAITTTMNAGTGQINFSGTLNPDAGFKQLFVTGAGAVNFGGAVGGIIAFSDISVSATTIAIDGALVRNLGTQQYAGAVTLGTDTVLSGSVITFNGTVSGGGNSLTIDGHVPFGMGNAVFNDVVSGLASLSVARNTTINTTGITTTGAQAYNGAVSLGANTTLDAGVGNLVTFSSTVNGARTLAIGGTSNAQFDGVVGGTVALTSLTVGGNTAINTTGITTAGIQTYTGAVDLQSSTTLNAGAGNLVTFSSTVNGASDLAIGGTSDVRFDGLVGSGVALTALTIGGNTAINTAAIRTAGNQTYSGAVSAGAVSFTAGTGGIDLRNASNDFTGNVTIVSAGAITLRDANALSLAGAATSAGQVFVATGNLNTSGAYTISGAGDLLLESANGQVTLGAGTSYAGRNLTVVVGENQSFINQAGAAPFSNSGGRTLVFSSKAKINSPSQLDGGFSGFQPYFNTVPEVVIGPALGTYSVLNSLPGGNLMVYRPPGSSPVHPDHVSQATVNSIVNTEAFQTTVPVITYSLLTLPRAAVEIRYRTAPNPKASLGPLGFGPRGRGSPVMERPSAEAKRVRSTDFGEISAPAQNRNEAIRIGEILIHGLKVSLAAGPLSSPSF